jgi:hypothetical protein
MNTSWLRVALVVWMITGLGAWITCERASGQFCDGAPLILAFIFQGLSVIVPATAAWAQLKENTQATTIPPQAVSYDLLTLGLFLGALCGSLSMYCAGCSMLF